MGRIIHYGIVLTVIAIISGWSLGSIYSLAEPKIEKIENHQVELARKSVLPVADTFKTSKEDIKVIDNHNFIPGYNKDNKLVGYVVSTTGPGYGGDIAFVLGISLDGKITGLKIVSASGETPGLGAKINEQSWQNHWKGKDSSYQFDKSIDAFAGATISPEGVYKGMQKALASFAKLKKGVDK